MWPHVFVLLGEIPPRSGVFTLNLHMCTYPCYHSPDQEIEHSQHQKVPLVSFPICPQSNQSTDFYFSRSVFACSWISCKENDLVHILLCLLSFMQCFVIFTQGPMCYLSLFIFIVYSIPNKLYIFHLVLTHFTVDEHLACFYFHQEWILLFLVRYNVHFC